MPTKRTRRTRGRRGMMTVDALTIEQMLCFIAGWAPGKPDNRRYGGWETWGEFMRDWLTVREEFMSRDDLTSRGPIFAEQLYRLYGAKGPTTGATYDEIMAAIATAEDAIACDLLADVDMG